jgi:predicted PurR-regulated permease PerM
VAETPEPVFTERERRWLDWLLPLATLAVALIAIDLISKLLTSFSDLLLIFFLAWLLAFILSPLVTFLERIVPNLPRVVAVSAVYGVLLAILIGLTLVIAANLARSVANLISQLPTFEARLPEILAFWQSAIDSLGLHLDLVAVSRQLVAQLGSFAVDVQGPLQGIAVASVGIFGNMVFVIFLSLFIVAERDSLEAFLIRLIPPAYAEEARLFETSVSRSFGGFLRGQAAIGALYGVWALGVHIVLGLEFAPASAAATGALMAVPFFGPFLAWAPPVLVAVFAKPDVLLPTLALMGVGWFLVMNVATPRVMSGAVGVSPLVVLASVLIGAKVAGIPGIIFGLPFAAVLSAFFSYYLDRSALEPRTVAVRAARRLSAREGRPVRVPSPPSLTEVHARADLEAAPDESLQDEAAPDEAVADEALADEGRADEGRNADGRGEPADETR